MTPPLIVVAVGGNALRRPGPDPATDQAEHRAAHVAATQLAAVAGAADLVVTHGNGPQVGRLAADAAASGHPEPFDVLDAESQGRIGYLLELELANQLGARPVVTVLTQVAVDPDDRAFRAPTKPVGPVLTEADARSLTVSRGWTTVRGIGGWRRVVPSPEPAAILSLPAITALLAAGHVVIAGGGGGIPVAVDPDGHRRGVDAVIDKDLTSSLLAVALDAAHLVLLTDVAGVHVGWGTDHARLLGRTTVAELRATRFEPGTMGPKVEAACRFVEATGRPASIGALDDAADVAAGRAGTRVEP